MQRLKAYCRRTILEAAREYADGSRRTKESTRSAFQDAMHGTTTGWWTDLIYTAPMLDMASRYRSDIRAAVRDFASECGTAFGDIADRDGKFTWADVIAATAKKRTWSDYIGHYGRDAETDAMALLWGLRFAVEYLTGELAREYCPDL